MGGQKALRFGQMARGCFVRRRLGRRRLLPMHRNPATDRRRMHPEQPRRVRLRLPPRVHHVDNGRPLLPIQFPHDHHIPRSQLIEQTVQLRATPAAPRGARHKQPFDPSGTQGSRLHPRILLLAFRHPCIAQQYAPSRCRSRLPLRHIMQQVYTRRKADAAVEF
jgi:hypothetical protein